MQEAKCAADEYYEEEWAGDAAEEYYEEEDEEDKLDATDEDPSLISYVSAISS